jgi:hypothetical protein
VLPSEIAKWKCPDGYTTPDDPVTENSTCSMEREVEPVALYRCPTGYSPTGDVPKGTTCTKAGFWIPNVFKWEWTCVVFGAYPDSVDAETLLRFPPKPTEPCVDTVQAQFASWTCPVGTACDDPEPEKPQCFETVYADPVPTYRCPTGYRPIRGMMDTDQDAVDTECFIPVGKDTMCMRLIKETPTCPPGQILEEIPLPENGAEVSRRPERPLLNCVPIEFTASASAQAGATLCYNDATVGVGAIGSGSAGSTDSQADAQTKAQAVANANAAANLATEVGKYPGATPGACLGTTSIVEPAPVTAPAPATVVAPAAATVSAPAPATVSGGVAGTVDAPAAATVPTGVPAGDGSQTPAVPMWALAMMVAGVLGAGLAAVRLVGARK